MVSPLQLTEATLLPVIVDLLLSSCPAVRKIQLIPQKCFKNFIFKLKFLCVWSFAWAVVQNVTRTCHGLHFKIFFTNLSLWPDCVACIVVPLVCRTDDVCVRAAELSIRRDCMFMTIYTPSVTAQYSWAQHGKWKRAVESHLMDWTAG